MNAKPMLDVIERELVWNADLLIACTEKGDASLQARHLIAKRMVKHSYILRWCRSLHTPQTFREFFLGF